MLDKATKWQLKEFCDYFIKKKKFRWEVFELDFKYDKLISQKILFIQNEYVQINNNELIVDEVLPIFKKMFGFDDFKNAKKGKAFLKSISSYFDLDEWIGSVAFNDALLKVAILNFATGKPEEFIKFAKTFKREDGSIFDFLRGFRGVLSKLNLNVRQTIALFNYLHEESKADSPESIDLNISELASGLHDYCKSDPNLAMGLYKRCIKAKRQSLKAFHVAILSSIFCNQPEFFDELRKLALSEDNQQSVIRTFTAVKFDLDTPIKNILDLVESINFYSPGALLALPQFYTSILEKAKSEIWLTNHCFDKILQILLTHPELVAQTIFEMRFLNNFPDEVYETLAAFLDKKEVPDHFGRMLGNMYPNFKDFSGFFKLLRNIALSLKSKFEPQEYSNILSSLQHINASECDYLLIKLLIDDEGFVRYAATRMMNNLSMLNRKKRFSFSPLNLSAIEQYKLVVSITNDFHEPKYIVPFITPLLDSPFDLVRYLVLHRLEVLAENYFTDVEKVMEETLDTINLNYQQYIEQIKNHTEKFVAKLKLKENIKEFDPRYNQSKLYNQYFKESRKKLSESLDKSVKENSLVSMLSGGDDIMLAKGGGFFIGEQNSVQPLSSIKTQLSLPREYYLKPERYDWEHRNQILENWKDIFTPWEAMISS